MKFVRALEREVREQNASLLLRVGRRNASGPSIREQADRSRRARSCIGSHLLPPATTVDPARANGARASSNLEGEHRDLPTDEHRHDDRGSESASASISDQSLVTELSPHRHIRVGAIAP